MPTSARFLGIWTVLAEVGIHAPGVVRMNLGHKIIGRTMRAFRLITVAGWNKIGLAFAKISIVKLWRNGNELISYPKHAPSMIEQSRVR